VDYQMAALRYRTGNYSEAEDMLKRLVGKGDESSKYFNLLGWCLAKREKIQEAVKAFDHAIYLDPQRDSNYVDLATVLMGAGLLPTSLEAANRAVEVDPDSYAAYRVRGQIQMRQHDYTAAVDSYRKAAELNSAGSGPLLDLAEAHAGAGQFEKACSTLEATIRKYPREAQGYYQYAVVILHQSGADAAANRSKATALLQRALTLDNSFARAHYELGEIWLEQEESAKALAELQKAAKLNPSDENTHYALWLVLRKLGRTQQAQDELRMFRELKARANDKPH
jgi:tetratricopeptide (TPR) repeat protein